MPYEITSADVKVGLLTFAMVAAIGSLTFVTATPRETTPPPPPPIPQEILDRCEHAAWPAWCVAVEVNKQNFGH